MINKKEIYEGAIYHITQRAPGNEKIFINEEDRLYFLKLLKHMGKNYKVHVIAFALMPNHVHLLVRIYKKNLPEAMKYLFQRYAQAYNSKYKRKGHVFCGVYRATLVDSDSYLLTVSIYIHLNPYKAMLVDDPLSSRWTSVGVYVNKITNSFIKNNYVFELLKKLGFVNPRQFYISLLKKGTTYKIDISYKKAHKLASLVRSLTIFINSEIDLLKVNNSDFKSIIELEHKIDNLKNINPLDRKKPEATAYVVEQLNSQNFSNQEIADILELSRMTVYRLLQKR